MHKYWLWTSRDKWIRKKIIPAIIPKRPMLFVANSIIKLIILTVVDISMFGMRNAATTEIPITISAVGLNIFAATAASPIIIPATILNVCAIFDGSRSPPSLINSAISKINSNS